MATPVTLESKIECDGEDVVQTDTEDVTASQIADMAERHYRALAAQMDDCPVKQAKIVAIADAIRDHA